MGYYVDPETALPHIYRHDVSKQRWRRGYDESEKICRGAMNRG